MIKPEEWMEIRKLVQDGVPIVKLAELLGRDRKTVAKAAKAEQTPRYKRTKARPSKLDPYKEFIKAKLEEAPYIVPRLLEMIQAQGFAGEISILKDYVHSLRAQRSVKAVLRFETLPGQQCQVDWAEFAWVMLPDGTTRKLYLFGAILGYSRMRYVEFTFDQKLETLLAGLSHAFEYFGGVTREALFDNMKTVVLSRQLREGTIQWHPKFLDFSGYYSFSPKLTWPYRAQTKGKIERTIGIVRQDFWPGIRFAGLEDLNSQALAWCEGINARTHSTTREIPRERLPMENLLSIAGKPAYDARVHVVRVASKDCFVSFEGNLYSIPWKHAGRDLGVLAGAKTVEIFFGIEKIAAHSRAEGKGLRVRDPLHFEGLRVQAVQEARKNAIRKLPIIVLRNPSFQESQPKVEVRPPAFYEEFASAPALSTVAALPIPQEGVARA